MSLFPEHYPEEYIDGKVTFFGRDFIVTPDVLIPRLETEGLVRRARNILNQRIDANSKTGVRTGWPVGTKMIEDKKDWQSEEEGVGLPLETFTPQGGTGGTIFGYKSTENGVGGKITIVDIGCGSGIIGTSVADLADEVIFLDISSEALKIAEQNFRTHFPDKKAQFIISNLLQNLPHFSEETNILFLTNLPYIKADDWKNMSADTVHEPELALFGGEKTGFELYEKLFGQFEKLSNILPSSYTTIQLLYEFGFDQRELAEEVIKKYPQWEYSFFADYAGVERFGEIHI